MLFRSVVCLGGNGTQKRAQNMQELGMNVIHLPKTIDNDVFGTDMSFGFHSALDVATDAVDRLHTTAASHKRVLIAEVMGNAAGWLTLFSGIAGGADVIVIPEIPYDIEKIKKHVEDRLKFGGFSVLVVAEGAKNIEESKLPRKDLKKLRESQPSAGVRVANALNARSEERRGGARV